MKEKMTFKDSIKSIPKGIKKIVAVGTLLGMASLTPLPTVNAEEVYFKQNESYKTETIAPSLVQARGLEEKIQATEYNGLFSSEEDKNTKEESEKKKDTTFFAFGTYNSGLVTWAPCYPLEGNYYPGSAYMAAAKPYDLSYSFGIGVDYEILPDLLPNLKLFLDGGFNTWKKLIAEEDGYGVGSWVWEQSNYNDARVGPFQMDTSYYMDTTNLRVGAKYFLPLGKNLQPWVGAGYGIYAWQATIGNREEEAKYGQTSGLTGGVSFLGGIDLGINDITLRIFGDFGAPVANPKIENLFQPGWTFENTGGEHVIAPYRFGIGIGMKN